MTQEQIEKAAKEAFKLCSGEFAKTLNQMTDPIPPVAEWLTRFAQQVEAETLERAELELCAAPIDVAEYDGFDAAVDIIKNLKPKAL